MGDVFYYPDILNYPRGSDEHHSVAGYHGWNRSRTLPSCGFDPPRAWHRRIRDRPPQERTGRLKVFTAILVPQLLHRGWIAQQTTIHESIMLCAAFSAADIPLIRLFTLSDAS